MIPAFLVTRYGPQAAKVVFFGGIIVAALLIGLVVYMVGRGDGKTGMVIDQQERELELQGEIGDADANASDARVKDAVRLEQQQKELDDAFKAIGSPDHRRALRGCVILRQQGRDTSSIPGCVRPADRP